VAVERIPEISTAQLHPERLLRELLQGPTLQEEAQGLWTAIPEGTTLAGLLDLSQGMVIVRLQMSSQALQELSHESFEIIVNQIADTLMPLDWRDLRIQVQDPDTDDFVPLANFLPEISVPRKETPSKSAGPQVTPAHPGQPPAPGQGQPRGALSGKTVYVSAGHGWEWNSYVDGWRTQRPPYPNPPYVGPIIEDHNNAEAVNQYLLNYLWNAGAMVWPVRERDINGAEAIVDDNSPTGFDGTGWTEVPGGYGGHCREAQTTTGQPTANAAWSANLPADGRYAVYVWFCPGPNPADDAQYTIHHAGGETSVTVDQQRHGYTWHYIGTYGFLDELEARVTLTNQSGLAGRTVVADAVRFGGGTFDNLAGIDTDADYAPSKPWWEVAAYYFTQKMGMGAAYGDVTARPIYARWEHRGTGDDAVYVSWHSNGATGYQWQYSGTETYVHNGEGLARTEGSLGLQDAIHTEVVHDIRAGWDSAWIDRGKKQRNLGELRLLWDDDVSTRMPGALIEIAFHDHPEDTDALKEPTFNMLAARAIYQGIVRYYEQRDVTDLTLLPEPPTNLTVQNVGDSQMRVSWHPSPTDALDLGGEAATGYRVYTSTNGIGWSNGADVPGDTDYVVGGLSSGQILYVRVTATNDGGESFPTETLAVRTGDSPGTLLVNGFDRLNGTMAILDPDPIEGENMRLLLDRMNRYDYVLQHAEGIPYAFDGTSNEAVQSGAANLNEYAIVDWILGEESAPDETLSPVERARLQGFVESGGALFVSGTELGWHLDGEGTDPWFYNNVLRADFVRDDAGTYWVSSAPGSIFAGLGLFHFEADGMYKADFPDVLTPINGSSTALVYEGGTGGTAAVQYVNPQNECERLVYFGFPFETVGPEYRPVVMSRIMAFLGACLNPTADTSIDSPTYGSAHATLPAFAGTAHSEHVSLSKVEVQIQNSSTGNYWDGSRWVASEAWLEATGLEAWSYPLPASLPDGDYRLRARARTTDGEYDETPAETVFTYDTTPPASTTLITPTGGATISALPELRLIWQSVGPDGGSELSYLVKLDGDQYATFSSFYTTTSIAEGPHTWGVQVVDAADNRSGWVTDDFTVSREHVWLSVVLQAYSGEAPPCSNLIINGGFETDAGWLFNPPEGYDTYVTTRSHSGHRSGLVGHDSAPYSSVRQQIALPEGSSATLRLWLYPISEGNDPDDLHYIWLRDQSQDSHPLELTTSDAREWTPAEYDVSAYLGQTVTIFVGAINDGDSNTASMYVDDVELLVCR
jgi:hypothetical protein